MSSTVPVMSPSRSAHRVLRDRRTRGFVASALAICVLALSASVASAQSKDEKDTIRLKDGKVQSAHIDAEEFKGLTIKGSPTIAWDQIASIEYVGSPEFNKAMESFTAGNLDDAEGAFAELAADDKLRKILRQGTLYHIPLIAQKKGEIDAEIAGWTALIKGFPGGRYHAVAAENLVRAYLTKKDSAGATKAIDQALSEAGKDEALAGQLGLLKARVLVADGKFADARAIYTAAAAAAGATPAMKVEAQLGEAYCLQLEGNQAQAETKYRELVVADAPNHVLAGAWNGLGDLASATGRQKSDIDLLLEAAMCYLRGCTVYPPTTGETTVEYERALAGSALCFKAVAELEKNAERKKLYNERATERKSLLVKEFPNSPFLEKF